MAILALAGIAGMYLRQVRQIGILGLVGYLLFSFGYLAMLCVEMIAMTVVPAVAQSSPEYVGGIIAVATNSSSTADLGLFGPLNMLVGAGYILGGLVFGIALFRAGILARWAAALLSVAAVTTMAPLLLPMVNQRLFAVPNGIAMIGLGWSLWREQRSRQPSPSPAPPAHGSTRPAPGEHPHPARPTRSARPTGWVPFALIALVVIPAIAGSLRLVELAGGPLLLPANPRMTASPLPVVVHITCALPYAVLGAFQFSSRLRRRHPGGTARAVASWSGSAWQWRSRRCGWPCSTPASPAPASSPSCSGSRSGRRWPPASCSGSPRSAGATCATHQAWMTRAYAIALAAGTQTFTLAVGNAVFGTPCSPPTSPGRRLGAQPRRRRARHPPDRPSPGHGRLTVVGVAVTTPSAPRVARRLRSAGRRAPRPALVGLVRRPHPDPRRRRHHDPARPVADQAELHGILTRIRDLGVTLLSVAAVDLPVRREHHQHASTGDCPARWGVRSCSSGTVGCCAPDACAGCARSSGSCCSSSSPPARSACRCSGPSTTSRRTTSRSSSPASSARASWRWAATPSPSASARDAARASWHCGRPPSGSSPVRCSAS